MQNWYVLYTKPHSERMVENKLVADGIETYYPVVPAATLRRGRAPFRPFFPCYLFARVNLEDVGISRLNWIPGMRHLVMFGGVPAHVDASLIARIQEHLAQPHATDQVGEFLQHGDHVVLNAGPFQDVDAIFDRRLSAAGRVRVLIGFLQQWTALEVDASALRKVDSFSKAAHRLPIVR